MQGTNPPIGGSNAFSPSRNESLAFALLFSTVLHLVIVTVTSESCHAIASQAGRPEAVPLAVAIAPTTRQKKTRVTKPRIATRKTPASKRNTPTTDFTPPRLIGEIAPEIDMHGEVGTLILLLEIDRFGTAKRLSVELSTLPRSIEEQIVVRFYHARYEPGKRDGAPIDSIMQIKIDVGDSDAGL